MFCCYKQLPISGSYLLFGAIYRPDVRLMALYAMGQEFLSLVEWSSMGNTQMNYTNCRLVDGNGDGYDQNHLRVGSHHVLD